MAFLTVQDYASKIHLFDSWQPTDKRLNKEEQALAVVELLEATAPTVARLDAQISSNSANNRRLLHAVLNILAPGSLNGISVELLDSILQSEQLNRPTTDQKNIAESAQYTIAETKVSLWQGDITELKIDAIVNAANNRLTGCWQPLHSCIDNAIHTRAGVQLRDDCHTIMEKQRDAEPTGMAKLTRAYNLPSSFVIHTVGPIVQDRLSPALENDLSNSYINCLEVAKSANRIKHIAFCCISTGVFGYPLEDAAINALTSVNNWLLKNPQVFEHIVFNVFSDHDFTTYQSLMQKGATYA